MMTPDQTAAILARRRETIHKRGVETSAEYWARVIKENQAAHKRWVERDAR